MAFNHHLSSTLTNHNRFGELVLISHMVCEVSGSNGARQNKLRERQGA